MAIPGFAVWLPNYRLRQAARDIFSDFQLAKLTAIRNNAQCCVVFDINDDQAWDYAVFLDTDRDFRLDAGEEIVSQVNWAEYEYVSYNGAGADFPLNADNDSAIAFMPNGLPTAAGAATGNVFLVNNRGRTNTVNVTQAGVVQIF
jgi:type IV fimbrial biogenesis protein FimT